MDITNREQKLKVLGAAWFGVIFTSITIVMIVVTELFDWWVRGKVLTSLVGNNGPLLASKSRNQIAGLTVIWNKVQLHLAQIGADSNVLILLMNRLIHIIVDFDHFNFIGKISWNN